MPCTPWLQPRQLAAHPSASSPSPRSPPEPRTEDRVVPMSELPAWASGGIWSSSAAPVVGLEEVVGEDAEGKSAERGKGKEAKFTGQPCGRRRDPVPWRARTIHRLLPVSTSQQHAGREDQPHGPSVVMP
eukprot:767633-Hanusia_phi.AAC.11